MRRTEARTELAAPAAMSVELQALRPNTDAVASELRRTVPELLAGIIAEVPEATLEFEMRCDANGIVAFRLNADAGDTTALVVDEIAAVLTPVAEVTVGASVTVPGDECTTWPIVTDNSCAPIGFRTDLPPRRASLTWSTAERDEASDLVATLADLPGQGLRTRVRNRDGALGRWNVQLETVTAGPAPALRLRAAIRRYFPGMQIAAQDGGEAAWLEVETSDLGRVLAVPVAGPQPPTGVCIGASAPIPVTPRRRTEREPCDTAVRIGHALSSAGQAQPIELGVDERLRHVHVLGRTGTGKSSLLAAMAHEIAAGGDGAIVLDPHGELSDRILAEIPDAARDRLWVIRCGDLDNLVPINPLAETDPLRRDIAIEEVCDCFQYLFDKRGTGIVGPRFHERVAMALRAIAAVHGPRTSFLDVPVALANDEFMKAAVSKSGDERVRAWWRNDLVARRSNDYGDVVSWVNSKFVALAGTAAIRGVLGSGADAVDFAAAMDEGRIIVVDLSKSDLGEPASRLLGYFYLNRIWSAGLRRRRRERPFSVIVDEAHTLVSGALTNMLAEGRKFGLSVILAHQYLEQLDDDLRPAVDGNVATTVAFRCAVGDAAEIYRRFGGLVDSSVLMTLPDLSAVCLRSALSGGARPHTLMVDHNSRVPARRSAELDAHVHDVMRRVHAELSEPFREVTTTAAAGASNVSAMSSEPGPAPAPGPPPRPAPPRLLVTAAAIPPGKQPNSDDQAGRPSRTFLDDWLARRAAHRAAQSEGGENGSATAPSELAG